MSPSGRRLRRRISKLVEGPTIRQSLRLSGQARCLRAVLGG
jgi:hypothetical protein